EADNVAAPFRAMPSGDPIQAGEVFEIMTEPGQTLLFGTDGELSLDKNVERNEDAKNLGEAWLGIGKEFSL
ncbi:MAG: hypothetical protein J5849_01660, partial [Clostridia bacterium]|nr:hypothetical protein [Clostridia bacterium]